MNDIIPTVEELFSQYSNLLQFEEGDPEYLVDKEDFRNSMIEFAKLHVQAALKAASEKAKLLTLAHDTVVKVVISEMSIREAYPLENIQ